MCDDYAEVVPVDMCESEMSCLQFISDTKCMKTLLKMGSDSGCLTVKTLNLFRRDA